jgi:hypothetical protein
MKPETIVESTRKFTLFSFEASHRRLLFRSGKTNEFKTRIDLLFQDVMAFDTRCFLDSVTVTREGLDALRGFPSNPTEVVEPGHRIYMIRSRGWAGFVVGGPLFKAEDDLEFFEPTKLMAHKE